MSISGAALKRRALSTAVRQFGHPRGLAGRLVGWVMAHRHSNQQRNLWAVSMLEVRPTDRVLEIGFGPGVAIAELAGRATQGLQDMLTQAGFAQIEVKTLDLDPPAACVLAKNPS